VVAARGGADGGSIEDYRGLARRSPWIGAVLVLGLAGLAGLPPGFAGLFAKVAVVRALLDGSAGWLAVVVAINAVIGLAYYARLATLLFAADAPGDLTSEAGAHPGSLTSEAGAPGGPVAHGWAAGGRGTLAGPGGWVAFAAAALVSAAAIVLGFAPQLVLDVSSAIADLWT
jgi:NADH-quinone oxidoreductase subunit N